MPSEETVRRSYKLLITAGAKEDLKGIVEYIESTLANPAAANSFLDKLEECYAVLISSPIAYAKCNDLRLALKGYRKAVISNYLLIYRVDDVTATVYLLIFFYGRQDYVKQL